jgi:hypothetical protein
MTRLATELASWHMICGGGLGRWLAFSLWLNKWCMLTKMGEYPTKMVEYPTKWWMNEQLRSSKPVQFPNFSWFKCKLLLHMRKQLKTRVDFVVYINVSKTLIACFSLKNIRFAQLKTQTFAGANPVDWCFGFTACGIAGPSPRHVHASPIRASIDCSLCRWSEPCIISVLHVSVLL